MLVRIIIDGNYGHYVNGVVIPKNKNSKPFELEDSKALRLISEGVAEAVNGEPVPDNEGELPDPFCNDGEPVPDNDGVTVPDNEGVTGNLDADQLDDLSINDLRKIAKDLGVSASGSKKELIKKICDVEVSAPAEDEEPPVLEAADPEV